MTLGRLIQAESPPKGASIYTRMRFLEQQVERLTGGNRRLRERLLRHERRRLAQDRRLRLRKLWDKLSGSDGDRAADALALAAEAFDVPLEQLRGRSRKRELVRARHVAAWVIRRTTDASYPKIGRLLGCRDHTSAMHAVQHVEADEALLLTAQRIARLILSRRGGSSADGEGVAA